MIRMHLYTGAWLGIICIHIEVLATNTVSAQWFAGYCKPVDWVCSEANLSRLWVCVVRANQRPAVLPNETAFELRVKESTQCYVKQPHQSINCKH